MTVNFIIMICFNLIKYENLYFCFSKRSLFLYKVILIVILFNLFFDYFSIKLLLSTYCFSNVIPFNYLHI